MTRILLRGISLLVLLTACNSTQKLSKEISKNSFPDSQGWLYFRDFKRNIQMRYLGDYYFTGIEKRKLNKKLKSLKLRTNDNDTVIFYAKTLIPPLHQSCLIKTENAINYFKKYSDRKLNIVLDNFIFIDSQKIENSKYVCVLWGNYKKLNTEQLESNKSLFVNEADTIVKSLQKAVKNFTSDLQIISNEAFSDPFTLNTNYLKPIVALNTYLKKNMTEQENNFLFQLLATYHSFIGNSDSALLYTQKAFQKRYTALNISDSNILLGEKKIQELLPQYKMLLFNEAHTDNRNRDFLRQMLPMLYKNGYKILALEALFNTDTSINSRKYPTAESGFYTREPKFSMLIREAINLGFKIVGYDTKADCSLCANNDYSCCNNQRELTQAKNIKIIVEQNPNTKIIVLGGHDHIYKKTPSEKFTSMAMQLKQMKLDFASIDQVRGNFYYTNKLQSEYLSFYNNTLLPTEITKLEADAYIIPPYTTNAKDISKTFYKFSYPKFNLHSQRLYLKIYDGKDDLNLSPIPIFVTEVKATDSEIKLRLPTGNYKAFISSKNKFIYQTSITVN